MKLGHALKPPLPVHHGKQPITLPPAVGKDQDLTVFPDVVKIVQKGDKFTVLVFEVDQMRNNIALYARCTSYRIGLKPEEPDHGIHVGNRSGKRHLL